MRKYRNKIIFKPTFGKENLSETSNDNGIGAVNFATSQNVITVSAVFPHRKIH
jgi:hypothetical protein